MRDMFRRLCFDDSGFIVSSEMVIVGTVGVLGMVVGIEAVSSAVTQELNDLSGAFGAISQSYRYNSLQKRGHAFVRGAGFRDRGDFCDCDGVVQTEVMGHAGAARIGGDVIVSETVVAAPAREYVLPETVVEERVINSPAPVERRTICPEPEGEIIEERIIRRRVNAASDCDVSRKVLPTPEAVKPMIKVIPAPEKKPELKRPEGKKPAKTEDQPRRND